MSKGQLELLPTLEQSSTRLTPVEHFKKCPNCGYDELTPIGPDILCLECC